MAAEAAAARGAAVDLYDAMPSVGRKFLMAGKSGLNLTHAEDFAAFLSRFGAAEDRLAPMLESFPPGAIRGWAAELGIETFVGSSGRVFPVDFKAAPLLRSWLRRLRGQGVRFHVRHRWLGWRDGVAIFATPDGERPVDANTLVLAPGGASWPGLGSDGSWAGILAAKGVATLPLKAANCGFDVGWSRHFRERFAGHPVKPVVLTSPAGSQRGEFVVTEVGIEGSGVYPHSAALRDALERDGVAMLVLDLLPDHAPERVARLLGQPRGGRSLAEHLRRTVGITGAKAGLARELLPPESLKEPAALAAGLKRLSLPVLRPRPIDEAISSAGGVAWDALDDRLMLRTLPGVFAAGEMIDWEVVTGGYLLSACLAMGRWAGAAAAVWAAGRR